MDARGFCKIALALVAGAAMAAGGPALASGRGAGMHSGGMHGGSMQGGFHHDGFQHDGFHHGNGHAAVFFVGGAWPGWWWGYPYADWPYPATYSGYYTPPVHYIEKGDGSDDASANAWWFRCDQPSGYYPYVKECPGVGKQSRPGRPPEAEVLMKPYSVCGLMAAALIVVACTSIPSGPSVMVLPGTNKTLDQFLGDDHNCRQVALHRIGGVNSGQASSTPATSGAAVAAGDVGSAGNAQDQYDTVYIQCMYVSGHRVPVYNQMLAAPPTAPPANYKPYAPPPQGHTP